MDHPINGYLIIEFFVDVWTNIGNNYEQLSVISLCIFSSLLVYVAYRNIRTNKDIANTSINFTAKIAELNRSLTEKINKENLNFIEAKAIGDLLMKLTNTITKEEELILLDDELSIKTSDSDNPEDDDELFTLARILNSKIKSYVISYLNVTDYVAYLFHKEMIPVKHRTFFQFYIHYAIGIFNLRKKSGYKEQEKFWWNLHQCSQIDSHTYSDQKKIPNCIENYIHFAAPKSVKA